MVGEVLLRNIGENGWIIKWESTLEGNVKAAQSISELMWLENHQTLGRWMKW